MDIGLNDILLLLLVERVEDERRLEEANREDRREEQDRDIFED